MALGKPDGARLLLDRLERHSLLTGNERNVVSKLHFETQKFSSNVDIAGPDTPVDYVSVIVAGFAASYAGLKDGSRQITALHMAGDILGLQSIILPKRGLVVQTLSPCVMTRVSASYVRKAASHCPLLTEAFWRNTALDFALLEHSLIRKKKLSVPRVAHLLCEMAVRMRAHDLGGIVFPLPLTQAQLGDALGLTSVHTNRVLQLLRQGRLIEIANKTVKILDWQKLTQLAEFDQSYLRYGNVTE